MHPQSYQDTQQYQGYFGYAAASSDQYGQSVGNGHSVGTDLPNGNQIPSSNLNWQGNYPLSSQHGTYLSQANYHANGSYGILPNQTSVCNPTIPASARASSNSHGYNTVLPCAPNLQIVHPHQEAVGQSTHMQPPGPEQTMQVGNNTQCFLAQSMPRETQDCYLSNNSQTSINVSTRNERFQMPNGQPHMAVNNLSANRRSHQTPTVPLQLSSNQSVTYNSQGNYNRSSYPGRALQLRQAILQTQAKNPNRDYTLNVNDTGHHLISKVVNILRQRQRSKNGIQSDLHFSKRKGQNLVQASPHWRNSLSNSASMASSPLLPNMVSASPAVNRPPPSYQSAVLSRTTGHTIQNSPPSMDISPNLAYPVLYTNSSTTSSLVPLGMSGSQTHSLAAPSKNMNASSSGFSGFLPQAAGVRTITGGHAHQESSQAELAKTTLLKQQISQRNVDVSHNHKSNREDKHAEFVPNKNPLLRNILENSDNIDQNMKSSDHNSLILPVSPCRNIQTRRAVAVVPPISKQPAVGEQSKEHDDALSWLIKEIKSLANAKQTEETVDTDCTAATNVSPHETSSEVGCKPDNNTTDKSAIDSNTNPLNNLTFENKDISKDEDSEQVCEPCVFLGMPVETFSLGMVRELVGGLDLDDQGSANESGRTTNTPDFARTILDLYWGSKYENYIQAELEGTFANVLKEAAEFYIDKDVMVFDAIKVENLNRLKETGCILMNCFNDIAMEAEKSSWRNVSDASLDIDKELADEDFTTQVCESVHGKNTSEEQHSNTNPLGTRSVSKDTVSKEKPQPSSFMAKSNAVSLYSENGTVVAIQPRNVKRDRHANPKQNVTIPTITKERHNDSETVNKEDCLSPPVQEALGNINGPSHQHQAPQKCENNAFGQCFRTGSNWTDTLRTTTSSSEHSINFDLNSNGLKTLTKEDCKLSVTFCEQVEPLKKDPAKSPCDTPPHIKLTSLSSEICKVNSDSQHQDLISSRQNKLPSPITISEDLSESDQGSSEDPVLAMQITVLTTDELKALSVEFYSDSDNSVHNVGISSSPICIDSEDDDSELDLVHTLVQDEEMAQKTDQDNIYSPITEEVPFIHSIEEALGFLQTNINSSGKESTSPPKDCKNRKRSQEKPLQNDDQHPSQSCQSPSLKRYRVKPPDFDQAEDSSVVLSPSGQTTQDMVKEYSQMPKENGFSHSDTSRQDFLNQADSSNSPEMPKCSGTDKQPFGISKSPNKQKKRVSFKLYGARKTGHNKVDGRTQYSTDCVYNLPPILNISYSPDKTSAREKIKKSWEDSFVPTPIKFRRRSGSESENREKDDPESLQKPTREEKQRSFSMEHQLDRTSSRDVGKQQQQSSKTKLQSKHKKHKHSLTELRRKAERLGRCRKSPQEKHKMGMNIIEKFKRIHKKSKSA